MAAVHSVNLKPWCPQAGEVVTSGYKWLRAVGRSEFTGLHTDRVFLGRGEPLLPPTAA
jgi:hypothetical protein